MKRCITLILTLSFFVHHSSYAQQTVFEPVGDTLVRFFFDENYYLVDKNCEFKTIERVAGFDKEGSKFEGQFKDFHVATGHAILVGTYRDGLKEGPFKAYYPDGQLRWETTFRNGLPIGEWRYYYADGKPHLFITLEENSFTIDQMWNKNGEQVVENGNGLYNLDSPIIGFTEHGYTYYNRSGKVTNGMPEGRWPIMIFVSDKIRQNVGTEIFEGGKLVRESINRELFRTYYGSLQSLVEFSILPNDYFPRAEYLLSKNCSFDDFSGFRNFIATKFFRYLQIGATDLDLKTEITYHVRVSKKGIPKVRSVSSSDTLTYEQRALMKEMVNSITYYLPSYLEGKPVKDNLTIHFTLHWNDEHKGILNVKLQREKGQ